jgi:hypothetical protein
MFRVSSPYPPLKERKYPKRQEITANTNENANPILMGTEKLSLKNLSTRAKQKVK